MEKTRHILAINVGSTSTKVAFYRDSERLVQESITYSAADLARYEDLGEQLPLREEGLRKFIEKNAIDMSKVDLVISRGGPGPARAGRRLHHRSRRCATISWRVDTASTPRPWGRRWPSAWRGNTACPPS